MDLIGTFEDFNFTTILLGIALLAPGFLFQLARSMFVTGRISTVSSSTAEYVLSSSIYYAIAAPVFIHISIYNLISLEILVFWGPLLLGVFFGGLTQWKWPLKLSGFLKLNAVTPYPTGWDKAFGSLDGSIWVIIHTKDLGVIFGRFGKKSNASSDLGVRDIFIEEVRGHDFSEVGESDEFRGMWISEDQILAIEIANNREDLSDD